MQSLLLKQAFHLTLTPSLKEAISLLQLSSAELSEKISQFEAINPFFEASYPSRTSSLSWDEGNFAYEHVDPNTLGLKSLLEQSLVHMRFSDLTFHAGKVLIENITENGFFPSEIFDQFPLTIQSEIDTWLAKVTPIGIGSRSTLQCLIWQLQYRSDLQENNLAKEVLRALQSLQSSSNQISPPAHAVIALKEARYAHIVHSLYWSPIDAWSGPSPYDYEHCAVDLITIYDKGIYSAALNPQTVPQITIHNWPDRLSKKHECRKYHQQAVLFNKMLATRWSTLLKAGNYIVQYQADFFRKGKSALRPLILNDIANKLCLHESTISRILHKKNILTPFGVIELKKLLSRPIRKIYGESSSHCAVQEIISRCIAHEDLCAPYSDQALADMLNRQGFCIARRTVTKYREQLNILSSHKRKSICKDGSYE